MTRFLFLILSLALAAPAAAQFASEAPATKTAANALLFSSLLKRLQKQNRRLLLNPNSRQMNRYAFIIPAMSKLSLL